MPLFNLYKSTSTSLAHVVLPVLAGVLLMATPMRAEQLVEVTIEGEVADHTTTDGEGKRVVTVRKFPIKCTIGPGTWSIESGFIQNALELHVFDGTNVYCRRTITGEHPDRDSIKTKLKELSFEETKDIAFLYIKPGGYPAGTMGVNVAWLAYCSSRYLKDASATIPVPGYDVTVHLGAFGCTNRLAKFDDPLGLPKTLDFYASRARYLDSLQDERQLYSDRLLRERQNPRWPFADGALVARYQAKEHTNYMGWSIPTVFSYEHYGPVKTNRDQLELQATLSGRVTGIQRGQNMANAFTQGKRQSVSDYRFRNPENRLNFIHYEWTNSSIPAMAAPLVRSTLTSQTERALRGKAAPSVPVVWLRWGFVTATIIISGSFIFLAIRNHQKQANH